MAQVDSRWEDDRRHCLSASIMVVRVLTVTCTLTRGSASLADLQSALILTHDRSDPDPMSELGQKAKYSLRAHIVCFAPESGLKTDIAGGPFRANKRHRM
jgi:hypothetical protein